MPTDAQKLQHFSRAVDMLGQVKAAEYPRRYSPGLHDMEWLCTKVGVMQC